MNNDLRYYSTTLKNDYQYILTRHKKQFYVNVFDMMKNERKGDENELYSVRFRKEQFG